MIALALAPGRMRVTQLQRRLPGISAGVLERYVQQMIELELLTRTRFKEMPPRVELELTDAGLELLPVAGALARWGARHLWSVPDEREQVDLGDLLSLLPALLEHSANLPAGSLEVLVEDTDPQVRRRYRVLDGRLALDDGACDASAAAGERTHGRLRQSTLRGDTAAWIAALGPAGERAGLRIAGDGVLAARVLDTLGGLCRPGLAQWPRDRHR